MDVGQNQFSQIQRMVCCAITEFCDHERRAMSTIIDSIQHGLVQVQPLNNEDLNKPYEWWLKNLTLKLFSVLFKLSQLI
jgi:hypothetical protein